MTLPAFSDDPSLPPPVGEETGKTGISLLVCGVPTGEDVAGTNRMEGGPPVSVQEASQILKPCAEKELTHQKEPFYLPESNPATGRATASLPSPSSSGCIKLPASDDEQRFCESSSTTSNGLQRPLTPRSFPPCSTRQPDPTGASPPGWGGGLPHSPACGAK